MRNFQVWNLLGVHVPNLLPETVFGSRFPRPAGRLIWSTIMFVGTTAIALWLVRRPKRSSEPATWAATFVGAMGVWIWLTLGYAVVPSEWIVFGNSYLNFDSSTFLLQEEQWGPGLLPFAITRDKIVDAVAAGIYVVVLGLNIYLFVAWQKRKVVEPAAEAAEGEAPDEPSGGILARLRARREARVSAYGRPVTTSES
jgi:hypothetical protein